MFLQRLKLTAKIVLVIMLITSAALGLVNGIWYMQDHHVRPPDWMMNTIFWLLISIAGVGFCFLLFHIGVALWMFIKWLIIEPYRDWRKNLDA